MRMPSDRVLSPHEVGFDYRRTLLEINHGGGLSYQQIADFAALGSKSTIARIVAGSIPDHPTGEAIYILYFELFAKKPPLRERREGPKVWRCLRGFRSPG